MSEAPCELCNDTGRLAESAINLRNGDVMERGRPCPKCSPKEAFRISREEAQ